MVFQYQDHLKYYVKNLKIYNNMTCKIQFNTPIESFETDFYITYLLFNKIGMQFIE